MRDFTSVDKIQMTLDEMFKLFTWRDNNKDLIHIYKQVIPEGLVEVKGSYSTYFKFLDDKHTLVEAWLDDGTRLMQITTERLFGYYRVIKKDINTNMLQMMTKLYKDMNQTFEETDLIADSVSLVLSCMAYMEYYKENVSQTKEYVKKDPQNSHKKKRKDQRRNRVVRLTSKYTFKSVVTHKSEHRVYEHHVERWSVRGHQRHLKNGKVIWVRPHEKGHGKKEGKIYKI